MMELRKPHRLQEQTRTLAWGRELVQKWRESGLSAPEFCRAHGVAHQRLGYWRARLQADEERAEPARVAVAAPPQFVAVKLRSVTSEGTIEVVLRSGRVVRVHGAVDSETVRAVIEAAEAAC